MSAHDRATARDEAGAAAAKSGVEVRELHTFDEFEQVFRLFDDIWHPGPNNPPVTVELMVAFSHAGGYVAGAFESGTLVGASVGFLAAGDTLHSHVTGASIGRGIGYALKLHQRAWCLERGISKVTWTFDPLVRRNARFNLAKLGAAPAEYLEDFYGVMTDAINEGDASDRLLALWRLAEPRPAPPPGGEVAVGARDGRPVVTGASGPVLLVATPPDIETLRRRDPAAAREWRLAVRDVLGGLMGAGGRVAGFTSEGDYVVVNSRFGSL
ncbi:GNAT family N-acetyltransferase [Nonomuraea sp. NN258]|uniref:GNAT family N-acetyltransferase n=1 Tax=Nonomuraea antri TaxID=2730852 RepID=UPI00156A6359|nr:GNAT family N-acetyltransferase [Nonomuraea antri]NRQ39679.1 GNAT family N-acetyltransferase [Nonomuraea antri]